MHAENLARNIPSTNLVAIADLNVDSAKTMAARLAVTEAYSDYQELLKSPAVEAVVVAVPTFWKQERIISALEAGKHVFAEKPLTLSVGQVDEIVRAAEKSGRTVQVGYMTRFDPSYMRAEEAIDAGEVGRILMVTARSRELLIGTKAKELPSRCGLVRGPEARRQFSDGRGEPRLRRDQVAERQRSKPSLRGGGEPRLRLRGRGRRRKL